MARTTNDNDDNADDDDNQDEIDDDEEDENNTNEDLHTMPSIRSQTSQQRQVLVADNLISSFLRQSMVVLVGSGAENKQASKISSSKIAISTKARLGLAQ